MCRLSGSGNNSQESFMFFHCVGTELRLSALVVQAPLSSELSCWTSTLFFFKESCIKTGVYWLGQTGWQISSKDAPVSTYWVLADRCVPRSGFVSEHCTLPQQTLSWQPSPQPLRLSHDPFSVLETFTKVPSALTDLGWCFGNEGRTAQVKTINHEDGWFNWKVRSSRGDFVFIGLLGGVGHWTLE